MRINVQVTEQDIENGQRGNDWLCPVCSALWRITGQKWVVGVTSCYPLGQKNTVVPLPPRAIAFIRRFDSTGIGKPFDFVIDMPVSA